MKEKAKLLSLGLAVITGIGLTGCSGGEEENQNTEEASGSGSDSGEQVIQVAYPSWWEDWMGTLEEGYEEENSDVDIELVPLNASSGDIYSKSAMMMKSPETAPDVIVEDTFMINSDVKAGYLTPIDDYVTEWDGWNQIIDTVKEGVKAEDGNIYGVPFSTDVRGLWYNKNLFESAGLSVPFEPSSWQDVLNAAEAIKQNTDDVTPFFSHMSKSAGESTSMVTFQMLYNGTGAELYNFEEGKWVVNKSALSETFGFLNTLTEKELGPSASMASNTQVDSLLYSQYMPESTVGMVLHGNHLVGNWREGSDNAWPEALDVWGFTPFPTKEGQGPGHVSMSGGWALSIPENADTKDLGWEFIKYATSAENLEMYSQLSGDLTVRSDIAESEDYLNQELSVYEESNEMLEITNFRPTVDDYPAVSTVIQEAVESVAIGGQSPEQAVQEYENSLKRVVGEENVIVK